MCPPDQTFEDLLKNPKDTIEFDHETDQQIREKQGGWELTGAAAGPERAIHQANFIEKMLRIALWLNCQFHPGRRYLDEYQRKTEWNDANNAPVGNGVSMVTLITCMFPAF